MSRGVRSGQTRASGDTVATEVVEEQTKDFDQPKAESLPEERARSFDFPGFSRMRTEWRSDDRVMIQRIKAAVDGRILEEFADAYAVMSDLYDVVREPDVDEGTGEIRTDQFGMKIWKRSATGAFYEDWARLGHRQREDFLYRITTALFAWEQRAADMWGEAMFAKAMWQERFAHEFDAPISGTVEDRTQRGNLKAAEDRYFALFVSLLSRKADAVVRTMNTLALRIKDTL